MGQCIVFNMTHGQHRYHSCAPCRILEILDEGNTFIVEIEYEDKDGSCAKLYNGQRLRLDITEVWAPVAQLIAQRERNP